MQYNYLVPYIICTKKMYDSIIGSCFVKIKVREWEEVVEIVKNHPEIEDDLHITGRLNKFVFYNNEFCIMEVYDINEHEIKRWLDLKNKNKSVYNRIVTSPKIYREVLMENIDFEDGSIDEIEIRKIITSVRKVMDHNLEEFDSKFLDYLEPQYPESDEVLTIYRGEQSKSAQVQDCSSWSLSEDVATYFATRFVNSYGTVYKAKVNKSDVLHIYENGSEQEILVNHHDVFDVEVVRHFNRVNKKIQEAL